MITTRKIFGPLIGKTETSQATISMPNGSHHQSGQHRRCISPTPARALACAKHSLDPGACLIDGVFLFVPFLISIFWFQIKSGGFFLARSFDDAVNMARR